jgi:hydrogenase maturation protein HypF
VTRPAPTGLDVEGGARIRVALDVRGAVQGVGFRPFVYRLATGLHLTGWVRNGTDGVGIEVEGPGEAVAAFEHRLTVEAPPLSRIERIIRTPLPPSGDHAFVIASSKTGGTPRVIVLPDIAICPDCLRELRDPADRRYRYPFINCTNCGPRYSIIEALPYDRSRTTMAGFALCPRCREEYENPADRRFHAEPTACPICGPHLELWDERGGAIAVRDEALRRAAEAMRRGEILALKGLGGFQLLVDAANSDAVDRLRKRKGRPHKPFALMYPSLDLVRRHCRISPVEEMLLTSPAAPIVLLTRCIGSPDADRGREMESHHRAAFGDARGSIELGPDRVEIAREGHRTELAARRVEIAHESHGPSATVAAAPAGRSDAFVLRPADAVAPGRATLGVMLPYTALHVLLMDTLGIPVVATSGNLSDEPICTEEPEAVARLAGVADVFLVHNRPIARPVDDSVVRVIAGEPVVLRAARGYAPVAVPIEADVPPALALGGHLKNAIAVARGHEIILSQHVGDLETHLSRHVFGQTQEAMTQLYALTPETIVCDLHPDYASTRAADGHGGRVVRVQHHYAHVLSAMAEAHIGPPALGIAWDGTGYGPDGTVWGGEFLRVTDDGYARIAHLRLFGLPGGEAAVREPRRSALGVLFELFGDDALARADLAPVRACTSEERRIFGAMLRGGINTPRTSSAGRLFDTVASLLDLAHRCSYEGQAAAALEDAVGETPEAESYPFELHDDVGEDAVVDWRRLIEGILADLARRTAPPVIASRFHTTLVEMIIAGARKAGESRVILSGGCFQNAVLAARASARLNEEGFEVIRHRRVPPNDGGLAVGQAMAAAQGRWR